MYMENNVYRGPLASTAEISGDEWQRDRKRALRNPGEHNRRFKGEHTNYADFKFARGGLGSSYGAAWQVHAQNVILNDAEDLIDLRGFSFASFAAVKATASNTANGDDLGGGRAAFIDHFTSQQA